MKTVPVALCLLLVTQSVHAQPTTTYWESVDPYVANRLLTVDRGDWVDELLAAPLSTDPAALAIRLNVMLRDGNHAEARRTIEAMSKLDLAMQSHDWSNIIGGLIHRQDADALARLAIERNPQPSTRISSGEHMVKRWATQTDASEIDAWLIERIKAERAERKQLGEPIWGEHRIYGDTWFRARMTFHQEQKTVVPIIEQLETTIRAAPDNAEAIFDYVRACSYAPTHINRDWLPKTITLHHATDYAFLASQTQSIVFYEKSLAQPFDEYDYQAIRWQKSRSQQALAFGIQERPDYETQFRNQTRLDLASAYHDAGQHDKAQALIEQLAKDPDISRSQIDRLFLSTQDPSASDEVILKEEQIQGHDPRYWLRRARYYTRHNAPKAESAYLKALELAPVVNLRGKAPSPPRLQAVAGLTKLYITLQRTDEATTLLWTEWKAAKPADAYAQQIIHLIERHDGPDLLLIHPDDERFWQHLAASEIWNHTEDSLLQKMVERAMPKDEVGVITREQVWNRAEALALGAHVSRSHELVEAMRRLDEHARAIPLLTTTYENAAEPREKCQAAFALTRSYLELKDSQAAYQWLRRGCDQNAEGNPTYYLEQIHQIAQDTSDHDTANEVAPILANLDYRNAL